MHLSATAWLSEFLFVRELRAPNSKPLHTYQVEKAELESLSELLIKTRNRALKDKDELRWAACFCLYVAETYRAEYGASSQHGWEWGWILKRLGVDFNAADRTLLVERGMHYWKRPIRTNGQGRDFLGSLFTEGGLPWRLVQGEAHGFGRAVHQGLAQYYRCRSEGRTIADLMADYEYAWPKAFHTLETRQLLAGIVEQLMHLVDNHRLKEQVDPAAYLDKCSPRWKQEFPIPLDDINSRGLVNEWLKDAEKRRQTRKEAEERSLEFTSKHKVLGDLPNWSIETELYLPKEYNLPIDWHELGSTRLELIFYEGEQLLVRSEPVYCQIDGEKLKVTFRKSRVLLPRRNVQHEISLRLLDSGRVVYRYVFEDSALLVNEQPLICTQQDDHWYIAATASCRLPANLARIRLPAQMVIQGEGVKEISRDNLGGLWVEVSDSVKLTLGNDKYAIRLSQSLDPNLRPNLKGADRDWHSLPRSVYSGWPRLEIPEGHPDKQSVNEQIVNGVLLTGAFRRERFGVMRYVLRNAEGDVILRRQFGVLPDDLSISMHASMPNSPARLIVSNGSNLKLIVHGNGLRTRSVSQGNETIFYLEPINELPAGFSLLVSDKLGSESVVIHLPFPSVGARLIGADEMPHPGNEVLLDQLLGMRLLLSSSQPHGQDFFLRLKLMGNLQNHPERVYRLRVGNLPLPVSLFGLADDIAQLLATVADQDAYVRLSIETTSHEHLVISVRRYAAQVFRENRLKLAVIGKSPSDIKTGAKVGAMLLPDPKQKPVVLEERKTEGVGTGWFNIATEMDRDGPWLIYPLSDSPVKFRPDLYIPINLKSSLEVESLHQATRQFHPQFNPNVIDDQIAAMSKDPDHSGWQYLADLKQNYGHLPLSSFQAWLSLSRNQEALAMAILRLELDEKYCARIRDELAVIWEAIPLPLWAKVYARFRQWLHSNGLPESSISSLLSNRKQVLPAVVSGFQFIENYLEDGDVSQLKIVSPVVMLPNWYQDLRRTHEADTRWPIYLNIVLSNWVSKQELPPAVKSLSQVGYTHAVTYIPIFMAFVTAGKAKLEDLEVEPCFLKFVIRLLSDYDRDVWYTPTHSLMVSYLLANGQKS